MHRNSRQFALKANTLEAPPLYIISRQRITSFHQGVDQYANDSPGALGVKYKLILNQKSKKVKILYTTNKMI